MLSSRISTWSSDLSIGSSNHFWVTSNCSAKVIQTFLWILQLGIALKTKNIYVSGTSGMYPFLKFAKSTISLQPSSTGTSLSLKTTKTSDFRWHYGNLNFFYWIFFLICTQESKVRTKYDYGTRSYMVHCTSCLSIILKGTVSRDFQHIFLLIKTVLRNFSFSRRYSWKGI